MPWLPPCDKCRTGVSLANDALALQAIFQKNVYVMLNNKPRHLLPIEGCVGSPSRAQYLENQPRDPRYPYEDDQEAAWRDAYDKLCKLATRSV